MNFFRDRPKLRQAMEFVELMYRSDTFDTEPLTRHDKYALRRLVFQWYREELTGVQRATH